MVDSSCVRYLNILRVLKQPGQHALQDAGCHFPLQTARIYRWARSGA